MAAKADLIKQQRKFVVGQYSVARKMLGSYPQHGCDCSIPNVIGMQGEAEESATELEHPTDAGQHRSLIEHVLEGADANDEIYGLVRD
jgi:hypothetical protein